MGLLDLFKKKMELPSDFREQLDKAMFDFSGDNKYLSVYDGETYIYELIDSGVAEEDIQDELARIMQGLEFADGDDLTKRDSYAELALRLEFVKKDMLYKHLDFFISAIFCALLSSDEETASQEARQLMMNGVRPETIFEELCSIYDIFNDIETAVFRTFCLRLGISEDRIEKAWKGSFKQ